MASPVINNLILPGSRLLVLPDEGDKPTTGVIFRRSVQGGGRFKGEDGSDHVLFCPAMTTEVNVDGVEYLAMQETAVVGLIPE